MGQVHLRRANKSARRPNCFIVGAPKCGTTALYAYLKQHPAIWMSPIKEPHFFATDLASKAFIRDLDSYLSLFSQARDETVLGEASVWYLFSRQAAAEIKSFCRSPRIIIMVRNPVHLIYSLHKQRLYDGNEDIVDFEGALSAEPDRRVGLRIPRGLIYPVEGLFYRQVAGLTSQVKRYLDVFGRENVHVIVFEDFTRDPAAAYRATLAFLGVDPGFTPVFDIVNPSKTVRSNSIRDFVNAPPQPLRALARLVTTEAIRRSLSIRIKRLNTRRQPYAPIAPDLERRLATEFGAEIEQLSALLARNLATVWPASGGTAGT
jgi:hypothetical protein